MVGSFAIHPKELLSLAASFGQGLVGSLDSAGCVPYHLLFKFGGQKN